MAILITIAREFGSGGRELGRRLADELGIAYYDKEILEEIVKETPYSKAYVEEVSESKPAPLFPIHYGISWITTTPFSQSVDVISKQNEVMRKLAMTSDCVIIGRAADYVLRDLHPYRIFVYADMEAKIARCRSRAVGQTISDKDIVRNIKKIEKNRRSFYDFYTNSTWGDKENYDLMVNTSKGDIKQIAHAIAAAFKEEIK